MAVALATAIAVFVLSVACLPGVVPLASDLAARLTLASWAVVLPLTTLLICIARLAKHRFFTPEDIHGSGLSDGTERAKYLQALLQNTLEQSCLAIPVYIATAMLAPAVCLPVIPAAALMFLVGRLAFFAGYAKGAPARAFGFAFTFYPTALMILWLLGLGLRQLS